MSLVEIEVEDTIGVEVETGAVVDGEAIGIAEVEEIVADGKEETEEEMDSTTVVEVEGEEPVEEVVEDEEHVEE